MLLIDSLYINNGGGKLLLDLLVKELSNKNIDTFFLFDNRNSGDYKFICKSRKHYLKASIFKRHLFYFKNRNLFTSVLTFGNLPPTLALNIPVYTYFHNVAFLEKNLSFKFKLKSLFINLFKDNTSKWIVQSNYVKDKLGSSWNILDSNILVFPFFNVNIKNNVLKLQNSQKGLNFIYVSDGYYYKNHKRLIDAFAIYNKKHPDSTLTLTISNNFNDLKMYIKNFQRNGVKIIDNGLLKFDKVLDLISKSNVVIYPSLFESFGLGLIEASLLGKPICSSNLPYVFEVVSPNCTFDPYSVDSIYNAIVGCHKISDLSSELVCTNKLENLINLITNENR
jgi:glycosyltransferase involved in cell wall biosynthesis